MTDTPRPLAMCALVGSPHVLLKPGVVKRYCEGTCHREIWVAPTTLAVPNIATMCDDCCQVAAAAAVLARGVQVELKIAPGALRDATPDDRRRRNELEAHGFTDLTSDEMARYQGGGS